MRLPLRFGRPVVLAMTLSLTLLACGQEAAPGDGDDTVTTPTDLPTVAPTTEDSPSPTASPTETETGTEGTPTPTETDTETGMQGDGVEVVGVDYAYQGVPSSVDTGTELTFSNDSENEAHELRLVRLPDAEQRTVEELLQMTPQEQQELLLDSLVGVSVAAPGEDGMVVDGELVVDEPGRYLMVCLVPTGADPDEYTAAAADSQGPPQVEGGPPHVVHGMYAEFTAE